MKNVTILILIIGIALITACCCTRQAVITKPRDCVFLFVVPFGNDKTVQKPCVQFIFKTEKTKDLRQAAKEACAETDSFFKGVMP